MTDDPEVQNMGLQVIGVVDQSLNLLGLQGLSGGSLALRVTRASGAGSLEAVGGRCWCR